MLQAGIEVLGVLADDDQVDVFVASLQAGQAADRAQVGVKFKGLTESHVQAAVPLGHGCGHGAFQSDAGAPDGLQPIGASEVLSAAFGDRLGGHFLPVEAHAGGFHYLPRGSRHFGADTVPGNQRYLMHSPCVRPCTKKFILREKCADGKFPGAMTETPGLPFGRVLKKSALSFRAEPACACPYGAGRRGTCWPRILRGWCVATKADSSPPKAIQGSE